MSFRVTPQVFVSQAIRAALRHGTRLTDLQSQATSGLKVVKPSDDPGGMRRLLGVRGSITRMDQELSNIKQVRARLGQANTELLDAQEILVKVRDITLQGQQAIEPAEREALAAELDALLDRLLKIGNASFNGEYLFGGTASRTPPFVTGAAGRVVYTGDSDRSATGVRGTTAVDALYSGAAIFQTRQRGPTLFDGATGAAAGTGTDSATGRGELIVRHVSTTYAPGSGVAAGTASLGGDTILGAAGTHTLTIDDTSGTGASGVVSLNGGPPVPFTSSDTNLAVTGLNGKVVYLDMTSITAGFSGTVDITAGGTLSVDGGLTETAIDFSANQMLVDSRTGHSTNVDSSGIVRPGTNTIHYQGTSDAFEIVRQLRDDLRNGDFGTGPWHAAMDRHLGDLDRVQDHLLQIVGEQGVSLENLDALESRINELQLTQEEIASDIESADLAEVVLKLQEEQAFLQFTLAGTARLFDQSILDYL